MEMRYGFHEMTEGFATTMAVLQRLTGSRPSSPPLLPDSPPAPPASPVDDPEKGVDQDDPLGHFDIDLIAEPDLEMGADYDIGFD